MLVLGNLMAVLVVLPVLVAQSLDTAFNDDVLGLIVFKAGLIDPQSRLISWNEEDDSACNWAGVKCDQNTNRVSELSLDGFSLSGHLGRSLIRVQFLRVLQLSRNNFSGSINPILTQMQSLQVIDLSENRFSGPILEELFQQCGSSLNAISLAKNNLTGSIPQSLSSCSALESLNISSNRLAGQLPSGIWSLISLRIVDLSDNSLEGEISAEIESLRNLRSINLRRNNFQGFLPENIGNCSELNSIDLSRNYFSGALPQSTRKLGLCKYLDASENLLAGEFPDWIGEMKSLEFLDLSDNEFSGKIPSTIGYLQSLKEVKFSGNRFVGSIPLTLRNCGNLKVMDLGRNFLSGNFPSWVFELSLERLSLSANRFSGNISFYTHWLPSYQTLQILDLSSNALSGGIQIDIGNFSRLQALNMSMNYLSGSIPASVGELNSTSILDLSHNHLRGSIPAEIGKAVSLQELRLENNFLTGVIPTDIRKCSFLTSLVLSRNNISGPVPVEIATLSYLEHLDLSFNNLSGNLPKELVNLSHLDRFNVSFNDLQGEIPMGGFFNTIPPSSVLGNPSLCGSIAEHSCPSFHPKPLVLNPNSSSVSNHDPISRTVLHKRLVLSISSLVAICAAIFIAVGVVIVSILNMRARSAIARSAAAFNSSGGYNFSPSNDTEANYGKLVMFSGDAEFVTGGTQSLLNKNSELGSGGFGTVYKTELQGGRSIAIKKLNTTSLVKCRQDFEVEVKKLGQIRHQNLVTLEGYYWTPSLQLLINEYIPAGSLHKHLHDADSSNCLSWQQRCKIILGTARGLAHLHHLKVIHYDIKSSNVLIDSCGDPKVCDFGLARLLPALDRYILSSKVQSALGYMAPEFACQSVKINEKCDIYGFGVLILEAVTGKRPVEYMEDDVVVLCDVVREAVEEGRIEECIDSKLNGVCPLEEAIPIVKLGLICASQVPSNRPDMEEVIKILELVQSSSNRPEEME